MLCKYWKLQGGVNGDLLQEGLCYTRLLQSEPLPLRQLTADPYMHRRYSNIVLSQSQGSLGPGAHKVCFRPLSIPGRYMFDSNGDFVPPTVLLGFSFDLGCGVFPQSHSSIAQPLLQCLQSCWGFSALGHEVSPQSRSLDTQPPLQHCTATTPTSVFLP